MPAKKEQPKDTKKPIAKSAAKTDKFIRAVGRRKSAIARVRMFAKGKGKIEINSKNYKEYFPYFELNAKIIAPLELVGKKDAFDFTIKVQGGGKLGQAEACQHGITRALVKFNEEDYKKTLRAAGFVTRDPRIKERKKPGLKKARRAPQWQKR